MAFDGRRPATIHTVAMGGPPMEADHASISAAIAIAAPGDTIRVAPGTYTETADVVIGTNNLHIEAQGRVNWVRGAGAGAVLVQLNAAGIVIDGVTFQSAQAVDLVQCRQFYCTLRNCKFDPLAGVGVTTGVRITDIGRLRVEDCTLGGGAWVDGFVVSGTTPAANLEVVDLELEQNATFTGFLFDGLAFGRARFSGIGVSWNAPQSMFRVNSNDDFRLFLEDVSGFQGATGLTSIGTAAITIMQNVQFLLFTTPMDLDGNATVFARETHFPWDGSNIADGASIDWNAKGEMVLDGNGLGGDFRTLSEAAKFQAHWSTLDLVEDKYNFTGELIRAPRTLVGTGARDQTVLETDFNVPDGTALGLESGCTLRNLLVRRQPGPGARIDLLGFYGNTYLAQDITNTPPDGIKAVFSTAGPDLINVVAHLPIVSGTVTVYWTSGGIVRSQTDNGVGGFTGDGNPAGSTVNYITGAMTIDMTGLPPDGATTITEDYTTRESGPDDVVYLENVRIENINDSQSYYLPIPVQATDCFIDLLPNNKHNVLGLDGTPSRFSGCTFKKYGADNVSILFDPALDTGTRIFQECVFDKAPGVIENWFRGSAADVEFVVESCTWRQQGPNVVSAGLGIWKMEGNDFNGGVLAFGPGSVVWLNGNTGYLGNQLFGPASYQVVDAGLNATVGNLATLEGWEGVVQVGGAGPKTITLSSIANSGMPFLLVKSDVNVPLTIQPAGGDTIDASLVPRVITEPYGWLLLYKDKPNNWYIGAASAGYYASTLASPLIFGADNLTTTTTTRYLYPGYDDSLAQTSPVQFRVGRKGTLQNLRVRHNIPGGSNQPVVYTVRVNGVATALSVSLLALLADGSDLVSKIPVNAGDLIDIEVTKANILLPGGGPNDIVASVELA